MTHFLVEFTIHGASEFLWKNYLLITIQDTTLVVYMKFVPLIQELTNQQWFFLFLPNCRLMACFDNLQDVPDVRVFLLCSHYIHHFHLMAAYLWWNIHLMELPVVIIQGHQPDWVPTWQCLNSTDWGLQALRNYPLSTTTHAVLEVGRYPRKAISISVRHAWWVPYFKVEVCELSNPPQPRGI